MGLDALYELFPDLGGTPGVVHIGVVPRVVSRKRIALQGRLSRSVKIRLAFVCVLAPSTGRVFTVCPLGGVINVVTVGARLSSESPDGWDAIHGRSA